MKNPNVKFYRDVRREYRWRLRSRNGRIVADSGEGYKTARGARKGFAAVCRLLRSYRLL
jgi:uncharacterized protein YegP (UPF0339 family)